MLPREWLHWLRLALRAAATQGAHAWRQARQTARSAIGVPDYPTYLEHFRQAHPGQTAMSYAQFFSDRQVARYRGTGGRCC